METWNYPKKTGRDKEPKIYWKNYRKHSEDKEKVNKNLIFFCSHTSCLSGNVRGISPADGDNVLGRDVPI